MTRLFRFRFLFALIAVLGTMALVAAEADARPRINSGTRGTRTYSAPPSTTTAPTTARPIERSMTQPSQPGSSSIARPTTPNTGLFGRGLFGGGLMGGLLAGFVGAGLFGLLFGHGLFGGLGGIASIFGLILQVALVVIVARLLWSWWQRRHAPAYAAASPSGATGPSLRDMMAGVGSTSTPGAAPSENAAGHDELGITGADFDTFERLLGEIETAYGREDLAALRSRVTPEMLSYFSEELSANASRGVVNEISDVKLVQGDLAEAWREGQVEYATVAMRYTLKDRTVNRATGRVVEGSDEPQEATEVWTFMRTHGGSWLLSAIQQV